MSNTVQRYTITSALPYANGPVHIGHLAGVYIPADIFARFQRLKGNDVLFIGGSDEHGVPITIKARNENITPQEVVDKYHNIIKDSFAAFGISFDVYSRTSAPIHHETAAEIFKTMAEKDEFVVKTTEQYYDEEVGQFLADRYITGMCPHCGYHRAYGDQCEKCGTSLNATDLKEPKSVLSGKPPVLKQTKHWFLPLDKYEPWLKEWILDKHKEDWKTNVYGQCKSWLDNGLQPRAVTRDLDWGVKVPVEGADGKVLYVWFDAPIGYISASKEYFQKKKAGEQNFTCLADSAVKGAKAGSWEDYWKSEDTKLIHFIGKDNIVFHCIIFPSILHAEGSYILPNNVPANEFLNLENDKISTSRNWAVWLHEYLEEFQGKQDVLRYVLTANAPETKDNDFTWKDFQARNNNELVAIFGNFVNRAMVLTQKYYDGKVPALASMTDYDKEVMHAITLFPAEIENSLQAYRFREALKNFMDLARLGNKYLADTEPWKEIKTNPEHVQTVLNISLQITANLAILAEPFLPFTSQKLKTMLHLTSTTWQQAGSNTILTSGHQLMQPELLFAQIEDEAIELQMQKLEAARIVNEVASPTVTAQKASVAFDDFAKMDLRTATILEAERVPKTDKLLKLKVDTGVDIRTVVSGIAEHYNPEDIIGKQISMIINLEPRKIKGIESKGMILLAENAEGKLVFVAPIIDVNNGSAIK